MSLVRLWWLGRSGGRRRRRHRRIPPESLLGARQPNYGSAGSENGQTRRLHQAAHRCLALSVASPSHPLKWKAGRCSKKTRRSNFVFFHWCIERVNSDWVLPKRGFLKDPHFIILAHEQLGPGGGALTVLNCRYAKRRFLAKLELKKFII